MKQVNPYEKVGVFEGNRGVKMRETRAENDKEKQIYL